MIEIDQLIAIVETAIASFGIDPATCRSEKKGQWDLKKGKAQVWIDIWSFDQKDGTHYYYVQVLSPVLNLDMAKNKPALFEECLGINQQLYGAAFSIMKNWLYLRVIREAEGMDKNEMAAMLNRVGNYSDLEGMEIALKYGGEDPPPGGWTGGNKAS